MHVELARALISHLGTESPGLEDRLAAELAAAHARWPEAIPDASFVQYVIERALRQPDLAAALPRLRCEDLVLAWWAGGGDSRAIAAFEAAHEGDLRRLLARFHRLDPGELGQVLRIKLFVGSATATPRILEYSGFGFLQNWYKVIAARTFLDVARSQQRERTDELADEAVRELVDGNADPRDAHQRAELQAAIKRALAESIASLPPRERTFLRHVTIDGLTLEQIAATYEVHRVTVARALASARKQMHDSVRARVIAELGIAPEGLDSAIQMLDSQLDLSLARVFRSQ